MVYISPWSRPNKDLMSKNKTAVLAINTMTYFTALIDVAKLLNTAGYKPILYFPTEYPTIKKDLLYCQSNKLPFVVGFAQKARLIQKLEIILAGLNLLWNKLFIGQLISEITEYSRQYHFVETLIRKNPPSIFILAGDNLGYNTEMIIKVGHLYSIPSIVIPSWMAGAKEAAEAYATNRAFTLRSVTNKIVSLLDPKWVYQHKGRKIIRWPAAKIIALKIFRLDPPKPWVLNSGYADVITAESQAMRDYMVKEGLPREKIILTGSIANDTLVQGLKQTKQSHKKPIILCALPPDMFNNRKKQECEFRNYPELLKFWIETLSKISNYSVILSLHPSTKYQEIEHIASKWRVKIVQEPIATLVPLCDFFVASISATIQWAIACGKPVINYDVYQYRYDDYKNASGVVTIYTKDDFKKQISKITRDDKYNFQLQKAQKAVAEDWGILDGKGGERILAAITALINNYSTI